MPSKKSGQPGWPDSMRFTTLISSGRLAPPDASAMRLIRASVQPHACCSKYFPSARLVTVTSERATSLQSAWKVGAEGLMGSSGLQRCFGRPWRPYGFQRYPSMPAWASARMKVAAISPRGSSTIIEFWPSAPNTCPTTSRSLPEPAPPIVISGASPGSRSRRPRESR